MSLSAECGWSLLRGASVAFLSVLLAFPLSSFLRSVSGRFKSFWWLLLVLPYLTPSLLTGYGYTALFLPLMRYPILTEICYTFLLLIKLAPVATLVLYLYPSAVSPEGVHCYSILRSSKRACFLPATFLFVVRSRLGAVAVAFAVVFLLSFSEFELASLLGAAGWTVKLFDAQTGGFTLAASIQMSLLPLLCEALLLVFTLILLYREMGRGNSSFRAQVNVVDCRFIWAALYLFASSALVTAFPLFVVVSNSVRGFGVLMQNFPILKEIGASALLAVTATFLSYVIAGWLSSGALSGRMRRRLLILALSLCAPGLLGALLLSLFILYVFQMPGLSGAYDTPIPLLLCLLLILLPFAVLLRLLLHSAGQGSAIHAASLMRLSPVRFCRLRAARLVRKIRNRGWLWLVFLLFCIAYFDMTASSVLAPSSMTLVSARLYNLMHYGRSAVLSAMVFVTFLVPFVFVFCVAMIRTIYSQTGHYEQSSVEAQ